MECPAVYYSGQHFVKKKDKTDDHEIDNNDDDNDDGVGMSGILFWATILLERSHFPCFFNQLLYF